MEELNANTDAVISADTEGPDVAATSPTTNEAAGDVAVNTAEQSFLDNIAEDLRAEPSLQNFKDINGLAKSYVSAQRMLGSSLRIPSEDASTEAKEEFLQKLEQVPGVMRAPDLDNPEAMEQFYNQLGRPETADSYQIELPEGLEANADLTGQFKEIAHKLGLTQKQVEGLAQFETHRAQLHAQQMDHLKSTAESVLKEKWGSDYSARLNGAKSALRHYSEAFPDAVTEIANSPIGNNPAFIAMLSELGGMLSESGSLQGRGSVQYGVSAEEARDRIMEIRSNKAHPFHNPSDPSHREAVEKMKTYYSAAYPDE